MKRKINCLGLLSLLSLIALLAQPTNNEGLYGFWGLPTICGTSLYSRTSFSG